MNSSEGSYVWKEIVKIIIEYSAASQGVQEQNVNAKKNSAWFQSRMHMSIHPYYILTTKCQPAAVYIQANLRVPTPPCATFPPLPQKNK